MPQLRSGWPFFFITKRLLVQKGQLR